jgi:CRISPR/Cas system-associated exonuclease Cas4 (RecB family)
MQLPVYLLAAAKLLEMAPEVGEAQYYYCTSKGNFKRSAIAGSELAERQQEFEQVLTTIADGAESGYFAPHPGKAAFNCNYCDYTAVCDSRIERLAGLKEGDARGAAFVAMQDIK